MRICRGVHRRLRLVLLLAIAATAARVTWVMACGPFLREIATVTSIEPAHLDSYRAGSLGVVRPQFARRHLVQAYRVLTGRSPLALVAGSANAGPDASGGSSLAGYTRWLAARNGVLGPAKYDPAQPDRFGTNRFIEATYQMFRNCNESAFETATETLSARIDRFGRDSSVVREWTQAQTDVFANCAGTALVLPAAPRSADSLIRADHDYQTAAAYFYAMEFEEAAARFRKIADDGGSPWQKYGRYLAARALIRQAVVRDQELEQRNELLEKAATEMRTVLNDERAAALHPSARGLLDFIDARLHQFDHLVSLSRTVAEAPNITDQQLTDYRRLMDVLVGDRVSYRYADVPHAAEIGATHELNEWILTMQGGDETGLAHALERWRETRSPLWLVSVLWNVPADHAAVNDVLPAAAAIERSSPAYATVSFLRIRVLLEQGKRTEARALLAVLPRRPEPGFDAETINLLNAARFRAAEGLDELLASAPRLPLEAANTAPVFDDDAGETFTRRLPLALLVQAAERPALAARLRERVAGAAFTRAFFLERGDAADRAARILAALAPAVRADVDSYLAATTAVEKRRLGVLLLLRTPGLHAHVRGIDDNISYALDDPSRRFDHTFRRNWWCSSDISPADDRTSSPGGSGVLGLLYPDGRWLYPVFLGDDERLTAVNELTALSRIGSPQGYLADQAVAWARAQPTDLRAAEALALAVEGGRWSCSVSASSRRAFQTLHRLFPESEWAKRTKYWYEGTPQ